jgi:hypothetical protein
MDTGGGGDGWDGWMDGSHYLDETRFGTNQRKKVVFCFTKLELRMHLNY